MTRMRQLGKNQREQHSKQKIVSAQALKQVHNRSRNRVRSGSRQGAAQADFIRQGKESRFYLSVIRHQKNLSIVMAT